MKMSAITAAPRANVPVRRAAGGPLAVVAALCAAAGASAQPPPSLQSCAAIARDSERLACFDALTRGAAADAAVPATVGASASTPPVQKPAKPAAAAADAATAPAGAAPLLSPEQKLGLTPEGLRRLEAKQGVKPPEVKGLTAHISSVSRGASGRMVFTLDNGQTWRQAETRSSFEAAPGDVATISSGALGSFFLATGRHNSTRVERIP